jgi:hypothetical protein
MYVAASGLVGAHSSGAQFLERIVDSLHTLLDTRRHVFDPSVELRLATSNPQLVHDCSAPLPEISDISIHEVGVLKLDPQLKHESAERKARYLSWDGARQGWTAAKAGLWCS